MSVPETVLIYVGGPAVLIAAIALFALGPGALRAPSRYRPGRPWPHETAWFVPHPLGAADPSGSDSHAALTAGAGPHEISGASVSSEPAPAAAAGGASGEW